MNRVWRAARVVPVLVSALIVVAACSHSANNGAHAPVTHPSPDYPKLMKECRLVAPDVIAKAIGADIVESTFTGAICRWDGIGSVGTALVTLNWFETGSLPNERATDDKLHYQVDQVTIQGGTGLRARRPGDPDSCGITMAAVDNGVIGWWVQYIPGSPHGDPCGAARELAEASLQLNR